MTERITQANRIEREAAADRLEEIATALRGDGDAHVTVGNKTITLHPPEMVDYHVEVVEKQRRLRGNREQVSVELNWKPD